MLSKRRVFVGKFHPERRFVGLFHTLRWQNPPHLQSTKRVIDLNALEKLSVSASNGTSEVNPPDQAL
jgi:hypothetical protein